MPEIAPSRSPDPLVARRPLPKSAIYTLATLCCLLWAGAYVTGKLAIGTADTPGFGAFRAAFFRFALGGMVLGVWGHLTDPGALAVRRKDWPAFLRLALLGMCLTYAFNYRGLALSTGTAAALIMATEPVWIAVLAVLFLRERITGMRTLGIVTGLSGALTVVLSTQNAARSPAGGSESAAAMLPMLGNALILLSLLWESGAVLSVKRLASHYKGRVILTYEFLIGSLMLLPFAAWEAWSEGPITPTPASCWSFLYLVTGCTLVAYTVWYRLMEDADASELTVFIFLQPVVGTLLGVAIEGTKFTTGTAIGAVLVLGGLWGITRPSRQANLPSASPAS